MFDQIAGGSNSISERARKNLLGRFNIASPAAGLIDLPQIAGGSNSISERGHIDWSCINLSIFAYSIWNSEGNLP